jgi:hypothetical protein
MAEWQKLSFSSTFECSRLSPRRHYPKLGGSR